MARRGRGRRGRPRGTGQAPSMFDQQTFTEVVGITTNAIVQAGIASRQEDSSNLQRFRAHHPPTFIGGGDPMMVDHWFMQIEKVLEAMTWTECQELFMGKYFPVTARHAEAREFLELKQGATTVMDYVTRLIELARLVDDYVATNLAKVRRFESGLKLSIRGRILGLRL